MRPLFTMGGYGLWYSRDDGGFYWQDRDGVGDWTSRIYGTQDQAIKEMRRGAVQERHRCDRVKAEKAAG